MDFSQIPEKSLYFWPAHVHEHQRIMLFGAGGRGRDTRRFLAEKGVTTLCFLDNNTALHGQNVDGVPVLSPEAAAQAYPDLPVVIASHANYEIYMQVVDRFADVFVDFTPFVFSSVDEVRAFETRFATNLSLLADEASRRSYAGHVATMLLERPGARRVSGYPYLRHPLVHAEPGDVILNIGAYLGGPAVTFCRETGNDCIIHAFEPSPYLFNVLCKNLLDAGIASQVIPVCAAVASKTGYMWFRDSLSVGGGQVSDEKGDMVVYAYDVDTYVEQTGIAPTLIQMGRGGLDMVALWGAVRTLKKYRPRLIFSVLPCQTEAYSFIKETVEDYDLYFADHTFVWKEIEYVGFLYGRPRASR